MKVGKPNRDSRMHGGHRRAAWCICDQRLVSLGQKCPNCGSVKGIVRREKKPQVKIIDVLAGKE